MSTQSESTSLTVAGQPNEVARLDAASLILGPAWDRVQAFGKMMARGGITVPKHFQGNEADCAAVTMQAITWGMNPFAVAQKTHVTQGGTLGYEAQLVNAVIQNSGELDGDPEYEHFGDWDRVLGKVEERKSDKGGKYYVATYTKADEAGLGVIVRATLRGEREPRELTVLMSQAYPRFSTQWATDPKQQICYLALRKFVRLYKPGVLLGVYTEDELAPTGGEKFMGPAEVVTSTGQAAEKADAPVWPDESLEKRFPKYREYLAAGKTHDEIIAFTEQKGQLTDAQKARIRALKPAEAKAATDNSATVTDAAPKVTYAVVADKLHAAKNLDELAEAASVINAVADAQQRAELTAIYDRRAGELGSEG